MSFHSTFSYSKPYTTYNTIDQYNEGTPVLPPTVPSSKFQTILDQQYHQNHNILTYNDTKLNYPSVNTAYPLKEPQYHVFKAPENKVIREFTGNDGPSTTPTPKPISNKNCSVKNDRVVERFHDPAKLHHDLKNLDVVLFVDNKCKFSQEQLEKPFSAHMSVKNIKNRSDKQMFTNHGGFATPYFFSKKTNKTYTGVLPTIEKVVKALSVVENYAKENYHTKKVKDLDMVVLSSPACPHCNTFKSLLEQNECLDSVEIVEDISKMGDFVDVKGFPTIYSKKTKKSMTGAPPNMEILIQQLS